MIYTPPAEPVVTYAPRRRFRRYILAESPPRRKPQKKASKARRMLEFEESCSESDLSEDLFEPPPPKRNIVRYAATGGYPAPFIEPEPAPAAPAVAPPPPPPVAPAPPPPPPQPSYAQLLAERLTAVRTTK